MRTLCSTLLQVLTTALVLGVASSAAAVEVKESHALMGALMEVTVEAVDQETGHNRIRDAVTVAHRLERQLSDSNERGGLSQLHDAAGRGPIPVALDLYRLLAFSKVMSRSTGGAFDVTIGPLLRRPGAEPGKEESAREFDAALALVGADKIKLQPPSSAELSKTGMRLDFGAVLRGYVMERMAGSLRKADVVKALLEYPDVLAVAVGPPPDQTPFRIWIPRGKSMAGYVELRDQAVSTSRSPRRTEDQTLGAIVDPRSGRLVEMRRQATVVARDAAVADAWSTALVVDPDGAIALLERPRDVEALVFDEHGDHRTPRFEKFARWKNARKTVEAPAAKSSGGEPLVKDE